MYIIIVYQIGQMVKLYRLFQFLKLGSTLFRLPNISLQMKIIQILYIVVLKKLLLKLLNRILSILSQILLMMHNVMNKLRDQLIQLHLVARLLLMVHSTITVGLLPQVVVFLKDKRTNRI